MSSLITPGLVSLDQDLGSSKDEVIRALATRVANEGRAEAEGLFTSAMEREAKSATGLPGGIGIPHCRSAAVNEAALGFARLDPAVDFGAPDGPADLVFMIAAPESGDDAHLKLLTQLARSLVKKDFTDALRSAGSQQQVVDLVMGAIDPEAAGVGGSKDAGRPDDAEGGAGRAGAGGPAAATSGQAASAAGGGDLYLVAVTACPTGIAHTYMAAEALEAAGERAGVPVKVETQGSGSYKALGSDVISGAAGVIFATDVGVKNRERFGGLPVVASGVKRAINSGDEMVSEVLGHADNPNGPRVESSGADAAGGAEGASDVSFGVKVRQVLLTGVSYMIPFVAAGGLLIALGFLFAGYRVTDVADQILADNTFLNLPSIEALSAVVDEAGDPAFDPAQLQEGLRDNGFLLYIGAALFKLGGLAFGFLVPALAGYIAFGIAGRPGIAPGFTAGAVAGFTGAGFIGGIVGGVLAGIAAHWIGSFDVPKWLRGLMPVVIIPLLATLFAGGLMFFLLGRPLAAVTEGLQNWLTGMSGTSAILLGVILGLMMCFDLGGPVNKAAYAFATAGLSIDIPATLQIMAAVMAAGMVPPLAMALATAVRPKLFSAAEQENGKAAWLLGASFISEGAIPFAAADPARIIPASMAGGAVTGALIMALSVELSAPHGGIFVFFAMSNPVMFILALALGTIVTAALVVSLKQLNATRHPAEMEQELVAANA